jgi:hypothetical protein
MKQREGYNNDESEESGILNGVFELLAEGQGSLHQIAVTH